MLYKFSAYCAILLGSATIAGAQSPWTVALQGKLLATGGAPVPDGTAQVRISVYNKPEGTFQATDELHTVQPGPFFLNNRPVVEGSEVVRSADGSTIYVRDVAYTVDYPTGKINPLTISAGTSLKVTYSYTAMLLWQETDNVTVEDGIFSTVIGDNVPFPRRIFAAPPYFVGIAVADDPEMTPRLRVHGAAYAMALPGFYTSLNPGARVPNVIASGILPYIGQENIQSIADGTSNTILIGEGSGILAGGEPGWYNSLSGDYSLIAGGAGNQIGDGAVRNVRYASIGGGSRNSNQGDFGVIAGGERNATGARGATVAGGTRNQATGENATVGGGTGNLASGAAATVPGGSANTAAGDFSFAAGQNAHAQHNRTLVWNGSAATSLASTADGQVLLNAPGGVGIGTNSPAAALDVAGPLRVSAFRMPTGAGAGKVLTSSADGTATWIQPEGQLWQIGVTGIHTPALVGIGTDTPERRFHVLNGSAGSFSSNPNSDVVIEDDTPVYLSLLAPGGIERGILFGEPANNSAGGIMYDALGTPDGLQFRTNGNSTRMIIDAYGDVGIGTLSPAAGFRLDVAGAIRATSVTQTSSGRYKRNVRTLDGAIDKLSRLRGVSYQWTPEMGGKRDIGFVAEEVGKVLPEIVAWDANGRDALGLDYGRVTALTVEGIKAQQKEIEALRGENAALRQTLAAMEARLQALEKTRH